MNEHELISENDITKGIRIKRIKLKPLTPLVSRILKIKELNELYAKHAHAFGGEFSEQVLEHLKVNYTVNTKELEHIPKDGAFIIVCNHPYGGIDGLLLLSLLSKKRPDIKLMANFLLQQIPSLKNNLVSVNPFKQTKKDGINITAIKQCLGFIQNGVPIAIFPAGEVSSVKRTHLNISISDKMWNPVVGKLIMKAQVPVIPVYFAGHNSLLFNLLGLIHPIFRTAKLPSELFNKSNENIHVRIGKPIKVKAINEFEKPSELLKFLRAKTYALGSSLKIDSKSFIEKLAPKTNPQAIINETPLALLVNDLNKIKTSNLLFTQNNFEVYMSNAYNIPNILKEITRLREITFRAVGEGTNKALDTDQYDYLYHHLFIWDKTAQKLVGAYRVGLGDELYKQYKKNGFYLHTLFKIKKRFSPILKQSLELGRSFIVSEYQRHPYALLLLWKGINRFIEQNNQAYKYLIGPVSISNNFSALSKDLMVDYITQNHFDKQLSEFVKPRKKYSFKYKGDSTSLSEHTHQNIKILDDMIEEIELTGNKIPVLLKKYLKQNAKIIGFNIDPKFNNALDGFLVMNIEQVPEQTFEMVTR
jgi:putative hemolysin